jgi:hypothetical protein
MKIAIQNRLVLFPLLGKEGLGVVENLNDKTF